MTEASTGNRGLGLDTRPIIVECSKLARSAERWGADPQGATLAELAQYLVANDITGAMWVRDDLLDARNEARKERLKALAHASSWLVLAPLSAALSFFELVQDGVATLARAIKSVLPAILELGFVLLIVGIAWLFR